VGRERSIERIVFGQETRPQEGAKIRVRRFGTSVQCRPNDKEVNLFAVLFGHDDRLAAQKINPTATKRKA
jgi:hypothetical protein